MAEKQGLHQIYVALQPLADTIIHTNLDPSNFFSHMLSAAFAKAFEFNLALASEKDSPEPFFTTATLRGICEDIIALKFLSHIPTADRQELLSNIMMISVFESMTKQGKFFERYRPSQPVLPVGHGTVKSATKRLEELRLENDALKAKHKWKNLNKYNYIPSISSMADAANLRDLYDYIYAATSKWVHFSPRTLLRMGWGDILEEGSRNMKEGGSLSFTTKNFTQYYQEFNEFYGSFLFLTLTDQLGTELKLPPEAKEDIEKLRHYLDNTLRWPEDLTYEEMNFKGPNMFERILLHTADRVAKGNADSPETPSTKKEEGV